MTSLDAKEIGAILTKRTGRGMIIFRILYVTSLGWLACSVLTGDYGQVSGAFFAGILFYLGLDHVAKRHRLFQMIAANPQFVYWAHPTKITQAMAKYSIDPTNSLTVHLRNGDQVELTLAPQEMKSFIDWLGRENPSVRWGAYDEANVSGQADAARLT